MNQTHLDTARLLPQAAPCLFADYTSAFKSATVIHLSVRGMPRLSVDLDLVLPEHTQSRDEALARINEMQTPERLKKRGFQTHAPAGDAGEPKLQRI